ncbi:hypothetical protein WA026_018952 [Henosepilachna vigintioctopunctata]|uniref:Uncharacterized protein n=1 Tax=Henosepilachna vigintioctopunctata TaxID=420089 RepID=A0AAW1UQ50_9CUCU
MIVLLCSILFAVLNAAENLPDVDKLDDLESSTPVINNVGENSNEQMENGDSEEIEEDLAHLDPVIETVPTSHSKPVINPFFIIHNKKKIPLYLLYKFQKHVLRPLQEKWQEFHSFLMYPYNQNIGGLCLLTTPQNYGNLKGKRSFLLYGALNSIIGLTPPPPLCPFHYGN